MESSIDHIGYLTDSIERTAIDFKNLGYCQGRLFDDDIQKTHICFMEKQGEIRIELVEPYEDNLKMRKQLKQRGGVSPYHVCYVVDDIDKSFEEMSLYGFLPMFTPVEAVAFNYHKICYFWKKTIGFVEVVEK